MDSGVLITTVLINLVLFFMLLIKNIKKEPRGKYLKIYRLEIAFVSISLIQYILNFIILNSPYNEYAGLVMVQVRFVCSLLTAPLVLYSYYTIAKEDGYPGSFDLLLISCFAMIICGVAIEYFNDNLKIKRVLMLLSAVAYGILVWQISRIMKYFKNAGNNEKDMAKHNLGFFLIFGWSIYLIALNISKEHTYKFILYSFVDFITKGLYSFAVNTAVKSDLM